MRNALYTKEKVTNKQTDSTDTAGTLTASSSDTYYPSSRLVGRNLDKIKSDMTTTGADVVKLTGTQTISGEKTFSEAIFTGTPIAPTPEQSVSNTQIATTAYVRTAVESSGVLGRIITVNGTNIQIGPVSYGDMSWTTASTYGGTSWRMPSEAELQAMLEQVGYDIFGPVQFLWSSTLASGTAGQSNAKYYGRRFMSSPSTSESAPASDSNGGGTDAVHRNYYGARLVRTV
jgi:hypothetical protein